MKRIVFNGFLLLLLTCNIQGQITGAYGKLLFEDTLTFRPLSSWINMPDSINSLWEIGTPDKAFFDAGYLDGIAMVTDSAGFYPNNCNDYFSVTIPWSDYYWGEGILSFYHKFDTDTLQDGGVIEVSYDNGSSWINIRDDNNHISTNFIGLYEDTIAGGEYGFSGRSDGWQYVELYWWWIALVKSGIVSENLDKPIVRFRFLSDNNDTSKEGWMIDHIIIRGYSVTGNIQDSGFDDVQIYPNPTADYIYVKLKHEPIGDGSLTLYDTNGSEVKVTKVLNERVDISDIGPGIYIYKFRNENKIITGKIVKH